MGVFSLLSVLLLAFFAQVCLSGIVKYEDYEIDQTKQMGLRIPMWAKKDAPTGSKKPVIELKHMGIKATNMDKEEVDVIIAHASLFSSKFIGHLDEQNEVHLCCSSALAHDGNCDAGKLILKHEEKLKSHPSLFKHDKYFVSSQDPIEDKTIELDVSISGVYYVYVAHCNVSSSPSAIKLSATLEYENPYGHLDGETWAFMPFYLGMSIFYILLAFYWIVLSIQHWRKLLAVQNCVAFVIALGVVESLTWYFVYLGYNKHGKYHVSALVFGILVSTLKRAVSRMLVLVVSMGYGVVKPTLGTTQWKVLALGGCYFLFSGILQIMSYWADESSTTLLVVPVALMDTAFYWWIFLSLLRVVSQLTLRRQTVKLKMYRSFFACLVVSLIISMLVIVLQVYVVMSSTPDQRWQSAWLWEGFWHMLYFVILFVISFLWRPTSNNTRYAYSALVDPTDTKQQTELQPLPASALKDMSHREGASNSDPSDPSTTKSTKDSDKHKKAPQTSSSSQNADDSSDEVAIDLPIIPSFTLEEDDDEIVVSKMD